MDECDIYVYIYNDSLDLFRVKTTLLDVEF